MMNILYFAQSGTTSSFSRVSDTIIPLLLKHENVRKITLLSLVDGITERITSDKSTVNKFNFVKTGSDLKTVTYKEFLSRAEGTLIDNNMKYILVQIAELLILNDYTHVFTINGFYETEFFVKGMANFSKEILKDTKIITWTPLDYIPCAKMLDSYKSVYKFITMTSTMESIIKELCPELNVNWIGHGSTLKLQNENLKNISRTKAIKEFNKLKLVKSKIDSDTIYILNANNCKASRKRFDITIEAFHKIASFNKQSNNAKRNIKLWLHTDKYHLQEKYPIPDDIKDSVIITHNNLSDYQLMLIYKICQIGLTNSTGEAWSLTNTEHSLYGSALQVVPDFLGTRFNFEAGRGILIPCTIVSSTNENNDPVEISKIEVQDVVLSLIKAIKLVKENKQDPIVKSANEHINKFTWESIANSIATIV
jgi:hypothetical protein